MMCFAKEKFIPDWINQPLHKRLMSSTRKLLQQKFCCCCTDESGTFEKTNEPTVVLTKSETITSQPGAQTKSLTNGFANGSLKTSERGEMEVNGGSNNEFDEIDLDGDVHQSTSTNSNKGYLKPQKAGSSGAASHSSSAKSNSSHFSVHNKQLAENVTDMMFNEICERAEEFEPEIGQEETFEVDLNVVSEATEDEISNFDATSSHQKAIPIPSTIQNSDSQSNPHSEPEDPSPRSLPSAADQPLSVSSSSLKTTGRDLEQDDNNNNNNNIIQTAHSPPNTPSSTTSVQQPKKPPRKDLHSSVEQLTAGVLPLNAGHLNGNSKGVMEQPQILPKPTGVTAPSRMYGADDSSDESESKQLSSSSPTSLNNGMQELKSSTQRKTLDKRNGKESKEVEQFDYKALETDLSERTI